MDLKFNIKFDIKKVPKGARIAIAVAPAVIIAILFVVLVYMPKTKEIKKLNADISKQENEIATNKTLEKKLAITTAKFNFTDEIKMEYLSPSFSLIHGAALEFYRYKNSDLIIKQDEFFPLWEQTGFFEDLLLIKTDHHDVDFFLLEAALSQLHHSSESKLLDEYPYLVTRLIKTLAKSSDMKATALLDLCRSSRLANLLINEIEREISTKYYPEGSIFNLAYLLIQNQLWADQYLS